MAAKIERLDKGSFDEVIIHISLKKSVNRLFA